MTMHRSDLMKVAKRSYWMNVENYEAGYPENFQVLYKKVHVIGG